MIPWAELVCRTAFSFLEGASLPEDVVERAAALGLRAVAITDRDGVYAVPRAHKRARELTAQGQPIRVIPGALLTIEGGPGLALLARDLTGWSHLSRLITHARCGAPDPAQGRAGVVKGRARLPLDAVLQQAQGLEAITLGDWSVDRLDAVRRAFGEHASVGLVRRLDSHDVQRTAWLVARARQAGLPLVATGDVLMHTPDRKRVQDVLTCIRRKTTVDAAGRALQPNASRHLLSPAQAARRFADHPQALERAAMIADRCSFSLDQLAYRYPREVTPPSTRPIDWLRQLTEDGLRERYPQSTPDKVRALVEHELALIEQLDFPTYFLTVHDVVRFARQRGILCQGRGSAANSAVCYALGITAVDPASSSLLFERFISAERGEPPDIDVDFEHERREEVFRYVYRKYGRHRAAMVNEVISWRRRSAVRDVGKALGLSVDQVDRLAKGLHWFDKGPVTDEHLTKAGLDPADHRVRLAVTLAGELAGLPRHVGIHVGGFTISDGPLIDLVPVEPASMDGRTVIQWDKDDIDTVGFVKVDLLALGMLTAIRRSFELVRAHWGRALDLASIPGEDPAVYDMLCAADTVGVFQVESRAQMSMLPRLQPRTWYDLVIEISVVRPGPIQGGMVHPYLRRRRGEEPISYAHPALVPILERTAGIPIFQEQVMAMAVAVGGFTPGQADELRRAMGAWRKRGGLEVLTQRLVQGMRDNGLPEDYARQVAAQIQGFGEYGFPESHAASFARLVYVSAWLKRHYPAAFAAALINSQPMGFYSPRSIVADLRRHDVTVHPIDVNHSAWDCTLEPDTGGGFALRLGSRLVQGLGRAAGDRVAEARAQGSPFADIPALARRTGLGRDDLATLARAGTLRSLGLDRRQATWAVQGLFDMPLFRGLGRREEPPPLQPPTPQDELREDYATVGLSVDHDPIEMIRPRLDRQGVLRAREVLERRAHEVVRVAGIISNRQRPGTASGVLFITLEDETGMLNLVVKPRLFQRQRQLILGENLVQVSARVQRDGASLSLLVLSFRALRAAPAVVTRSRDFH